MKRLLTATTIALPAPVLAHGLHDEGTILAGALHPVGGADHVLAMVAVGLLAAQMQGRAVWLLPLSFLAAMLAGAAMGSQGLPFPAVEPMILASIMVMGVLVALAARLPVAAVAAMVALFGAAHGWAHGAEGPATGLLAYMAGFVASTALLHLGGLALGRLLPMLTLRGLGAGTAVAGAALAMV